MRFNKIFWVSKDALEDYYYKDAIREKSIVLQNVIDSKKVIEKSNEYKYSKSYDLVYIGRLTTQKNPNKLIRIVKMIKDKRDKTTLALIGDGELKDEIKNEIEKNSLDKNVKMLGYVNNPFPILKRSKIFVMTSDYEGTPMAALEAQALGKPIIGTPVDGLSKIVVNNYNGFLHRDEKVLANKIVEMLKPNEYEVYSANTISSFNDRNNIGNYMNKILQTYE